MTKSECEVIGLDLPAYARGSLAPGEVPMVEVHLRDCPSCQDELREVEAVGALLDGRLEVIEPSPTFASVFANRLAAEMVAEEERAANRGSFGLRLPTWLVPLGAAAVLAVVMFGQNPAGRQDVAEGPRAGTGPAVVASVDRGPGAADPGDEEKMLASPPPDLKERADLFVDYAIIENLDVLQSTASAG